VRIGEVHTFLLTQVQELSPGSVRVIVTAIRALLRWLFLEQVIATDLVAGVAGVAYPSEDAALVKALTPVQVRALLEAVPPGETGVRDTAIIVILSRLGLRSSEVAAMRLDDIDWRAGLIGVRGKAAAVDRLPLPTDAGAALAAYLQVRAEPVSAGAVNGGATGSRDGHSDLRRRVFLQVNAPYRPLGRHGVSDVAARAAVRAGLPGPVHAHRLRHSTATAVLAAGGGMSEAGQLLRHADAASTAIYAKTNITALSVLARPWPLLPARPPAGGSAGADRDPASQLDAS
jgi:site-specific recombinase XerD